MDDADEIETVGFSGVSALAATATTEHFSQAVLDFVGRAAKVRNFGAFFFPDIRRDSPVLSIWSGSISDYWFRRNAQKLLTDPAHVTDLRRTIGKAPKDGVRLTYFSPAQGDRRYALYARAKLHGRVSVSSHSGHTGLHCFFLRSASDGAFSDAERARLREALPVAHTLIALRHRIIGTEAVRYLPSRTATSLRARGVKGFSGLSPREAEACDLIALGLSARSSAARMGVSENSVRTLRQRAYRKLGVASSSEVAAIILKNGPTADTASAHPSAEDGHG